MLTGVEGWRVRVLRGRAFFGGVAIIAVLLTELWAARTLESPVSLFRFIDISLQTGITGTNTYGGKDHKSSILEATGNGVAIFDYDGDGANDVFIANGTTLAADAPLTHSQLYRNDGAGHFTDVAAQSGLTRTGWAQGACAADFDNDGHTDLLVTYYGHNSLYRNLGNGKFLDVSEASGLPVTGNRWGAGCAFLDYDRDGYVDIFVSNYVGLEPPSLSGALPGCNWKGLTVSCGPKGLPLAHNILYHNNRDGTFTDVSERAGILLPGGRYGLGVAAADFDNDGWPDIYVACDQSPSLLYHNNGDGTFTERGDIAGVAYSADGRLQAGMGTAVADYDGNGFLDIAKTNFSGDMPSFYKNENGILFEDVSRAAGLGAHQLLGWGVAFLDIDEDGWPDLLMANGHVYPEVDGSPIGETYAQRTLLYRNSGKGGFTDITRFAGLPFAAKRTARGLAVGDLDGDGRPEIVIVNMNAKPTVLKNVGMRGSAIAIRLAGVRSNRSAIGARVTVTAGGHKQLAEVMSGGSYFSQNSMTLYFGLAQAQTIDRLEVLWPSGDKQQWTHLAANATLQITEGSNVTERIAWRR